MRSIESMNASVLETLTVAKQAAEAAEITYDMRLGELQYMKEVAECDHDIVTMSGFPCCKKCHYYWSNEA